MEFCGGSKLGKNGGNPQKLDPPTDNRHVHQSYLAEAKQSLRELGGWPRACRNVLTFYKCIAFLPLCKKELALY